MSNIDAGAKSLEELAPGSGSGDLHQSGRERRTIGRKQNNNVRNTMTGKGREMYD